MKYVQLEIGTLHDPDILLLKNKMGDTGRWIFVGMLLLMGQEFDPESPGVVCFEKKFITKSLGVQFKTILKFFSICNDMKKKRFEVGFEDEERIIISCPKFSKICDNYAKKLLKKEHGKDVQSTENVPPKLEVVVEVIKDTTVSNYDDLVKKHGKILADEKIQKIKTKYKNTKKNIYELADTWITEDKRPTKCPSCKEPCLPTDTECKFCGEEI